MAKIYGKQDFVTAMWWDDETVRVVVGTDDVIEFFADLSRDSARLLIEQLERAMDDEGESDGVDDELAEEMRTDVEGELIDEHY